MQQQSRSEHIKKRKIYWGFAAHLLKNPTPCFRPYRLLPNALHTI